MSFSECLFFLLGLTYLIVVNPLLVHAHNRLLQVLVVFDLLQGRVDIVLERRNLVLLRTNIRIKLFLLRLQALHLQLQILHNQLQVDFDTREMDNFLLHLCGLLLECS